MTLERTSEAEALDLAVLHLPFGRRVRRLLPLVLPYLGYLLFHILLSPFLAVNGIIRARRRAYRVLLWGRFLGGRFVSRPRAGRPRHDVANRSLVMLAGGLGELRIANQFAREIAGLHSYPVSFAVQTEVIPPANLLGQLNEAPFNNPFSVGLFLLKSRPMAIFAPEFCDNIHLKFACRVFGIPLVIFNVNTTEREVQRKKRFSTWRWELAGAYITQNALQRERLLRIGVRSDQALELGSIGVFLEPPADMEGIRSRWLSDLGLEEPRGPVLLCGSTHIEDEEIVFPAWSQFLTGNPGATMILAVRNRLRFDEVEATLLSGGSVVARRSRGEKAPSGGVYMLDTYGELVEAYCVADQAFVGGTYDNWRGGHTPAEALVWGTPLTLGPNFQQHTNVFDVLIERGIAVVCRDAASLCEGWERFAEDAELRHRVHDLTDDLSARGRELGRRLFVACKVGS